MPFDISKYAAEHAVPMERNIETVTEEILRLKSDAGNAIIAIGQRLTEAKGMLPHGEWLPWLTERVDFSERTAQNFMRLAREWSNPQALADLGATKALTLLALPEAERDAFIADAHEVAGETKTVSEMSSRELAEAIRERDEARRAKESAEEARAKMEEDMAALKAFNASSMEAQAEARKALAKAEAEIKELKSRPVEVAVEVDEKAVDKARKDAIAEMQAKVDKAKADAKKADALRKEAEADLAAAREKLAASKPSAGAAAISGDKELTIFEIHFAQAQESVNKMHGILLKMRSRDADKAAKLQQALTALADMVRGCAQ